MIEKHFTDKNDKEGPDHKFSMNPKSWREMIVRSRELENSLGSENKIIEKNELETVILQRRAIRSKTKLQKGQKLRESDLISLRPCPPKSILPYELKKVVGKKLKRNIEKGDLIEWKDLKS